MPDESNAAQPQGGDEEVAPSETGAAGAAAAESAPAETRSGEHEAPDGAPLHPLIDLSRDPTPGKPDHARPEDE